MKLTEHNNPLYNTAKYFVKNKRTLFIGNPYVF